MPKELPHIELLKLSERLATGVEQGESQFREFKSAVDRSDVPPKGRDVRAICRDIGETLVSFANADGGELFVGVEDEGAITGIPHKDSLILAMTKAPETHVHPSTPLASPNVLRFKTDGFTVLYFQVSKSTTRVHLTADGRCLQRFDKENRPVPAEEIQYSRQERNSREYDREFVDGARVSDLDSELIQRISRLIAGGQSPEKFLQYVDLADYRAEGLALRRASLLLFARDINKWHPRCQVRIARVSGTVLKVGQDYNIASRDDHIVRGNVLRILDNAWDALRPYLARTRLVDSSIFAESLVYPEDACREALVNAVAHRDYSIEGKGVEILIFDDRLEINSPGQLLSSISISDLKSGKRSHQSRNAYIARVLRELGYMREMGEGMLRIFARMRDQDLVPPEINSASQEFELTLHHRSVFSPKDQEWLNAYSQYALSRDEQRVVLLGRGGTLLSTNDILKALNIGDVDEFRKLIERLRRKGIIYNTATSRRAGVQSRNARRWAVRPPDQTEQYRNELITVLSGKVQGPIDSVTARKIVAALSPASPYKEKLQESPKLLGFVDERSRPLPSLLVSLGQQPIARRATPSKPSKSEQSLSNHGHPLGKIQAIKTNGYGFIETSDGNLYFFHISDLTERSYWDRMQVGDIVTFSPHEGQKGLMARQVQPA
jgi:ATP-dependent DNA helicase RecG